MRTRLGLLVSLACALGLSSTAHAYRPFTGTDADVAEIGEFELELGPVQWLTQAGRNHLLMPATVLNLGILPRTELVVDFIGHLPLRPVRGEPSYQLTDTDVLLKIIVRKGALQEETGPSVAIELGPLVPELQGEHGFGASAALIASERWDWLLVHLNNQAQWTRSELTFWWQSSLIAELRFDDVLWPVTELLWEYLPRSRLATYSALIGAIWRVQDSFSCDAAVLVASSRASVALEGRLGFTWAIDVWRP